MLENPVQHKIPISQIINDSQFFYKKLRRHIKLVLRKWIVSISYRISLQQKKWKEYIKILEKCFIIKCLTDDADTIYWRYDLRETICKKITDSDVLETGDVVKTDKIYYL